MKKSILVALRRAWLDYQPLLRFEAGGLWEALRRRRLRSALAERPQIEHARRSRRMAEELDATAEVEVVLAKNNNGFGALLEDTGEFQVVLVSTDKKLGASEAKTEALAAAQTARAVEARLKSDALGTWDPETVDWSTPALLFEQTALQRMSSLGRLASGDDRLAVAGQVASYVLLDA